VVLPDERSALGDRGLPYAGAILAHEGRP
jgi:hypothetical protein